MTVDEHVERASNLSKWLSARLCSSEECLEREGWSAMTNTIDVGSQVALAALLDTNCLEIGLTETAMFDDALWSGDGASELLAADPRVNRLVMAAVVSPGCGRAGDGRRAPRPRRRALPDARLRPRVGGSSPGRHQPLGPRRRGRPPHPRPRPRGPRRGHRRDAPSGVPHRPRQLRARRASSLGPVHRPLRGPTGRAVPWFGDERTPGPDGVVRERRRAALGRVAGPRSSPPPSGRTRSRGRSTCRA